MTTSFRVLYVCVVVLVYAVFAIVFMGIASYTASKGVVHMKRTFFWLVSLWLVLLLVPFFARVSLAESKIDAIIDELNQKLSEAFDYCDIRYNDEKNNLLVTVGIDGLAKAVYEAKENKTEEALETWGQLKDVFVSMQSVIATAFEMDGLPVPNVYLMLVNDDNAIRNDYSGGGSYALLAYANDLLLIDEMKD